MPAPILAYSYRRFSSPEQAKGDSIRRQTEARETWLTANPGVRLDTSLTLDDKGLSAYKRDDWDAYALAEFLKRVKTGNVRRGSYLLVENLDRISRENVGDAVELFLSIVNSGIVVVQLLPIVMEFRRPVDAYSLMFAVMELSRGNSESAMKSVRVGAARAARRSALAHWVSECKRCETAGKPAPPPPEQAVIARHPGWVRKDESKRLVLIPEHAELVRRIFALAVAGSGVASIARRLNEESVPVMGRKSFRGREVAWNETVVYSVLTSRATFGEYVPHTGRGSNRKPAGDPIPNYYPAVIDRTTFDRARAAMKSRRGRGSGRRGKHLNLFSGLLYDARDGGTLTYKHSDKLPSIIIPVGAKQGHGSWTSFPADRLERALRAMLFEVAEEDIVGDNSAAQKTEILAWRKAELDDLIGKWKAKMGDPNLVDIVAAKLAELNAERKTVDAELEEARREAASPASAAFHELRTLAGLDPDADTDELRVRIRAAIRRAIDSVWCLFVPRGRDRLAYVQVFFRGADRYRTYMILHRSPKGNQRGRFDNGGFVVRSVISDLGPKTPSLRDPKLTEKGQSEPALFFQAALLLTDLDSFSRPGPVRLGKKWADRRVQAMFTVS